MPTTPAGHAVPSDRNTPDGRAAELEEGLVTDPYGVYARLREEAPVRRITGPDGAPSWLVTRYEDARAALADPALSLDKAHALPGSYRGLQLPPALDANLLNMDPPDHTRIRRLVTRAFTARRIERLRAPIRRTAEQLLDTIAPLGRADLVSRYAAPLPIAVICDLLGVPDHHRHDFRTWTDTLIAPDPSRPAAAKEAVAAMLGFFRQLIADKRAEPADDLLSDLIAVRDENENKDENKDESENKNEGPDAHAHADTNADTNADDDGSRLSEDELMSLAFLILFAGYENAVQLIGNAVLALLDHPDQLAALRADPARIGPAVEEFARYDGPALLAIRRFPVRDVRIGGVLVPAGETVLVSLAGANRDPHRFPDPDRLDLTRDASGHLALGHGIHYCLGAPLARLEVEIALAALLERFPGLALDCPRSELTWRPSMRARGLERLPIVF